MPLKPHLIIKIAFELTLLYFSECVVLFLSLFKQVWVDYILQLGLNWFNFSHHFEMIFLSLFSLMQLVVFFVQDSFVKDVILIFHLFSYLFCVNLLIFDTRVEPLKGFFLRHSDSRVD